MTSDSWTYLDVAVPLLLDSIERSDLVFTGVPVYMQILLVFGPVELFVHLFDYLFVGTALERHTLALVVEAKIYVYRHLDASTARI